MPLCDYGCGQKAIFQFKSGKWCCDTSVNRCPQKIKNDSEKKKGKNPFEGREHPRGCTGKVPHNKGKSYEEIYGERASDIKSKISEKSKGRNSWLYRNEEQRKKQIESFKKNRMSGYIKGSGRGKKGWYQNIWCDSSWELAFVLYHLDNKIPIERNTKRYPYVYNSKTYNFLPDFIVNNEVIEIKGRWTDKEEEKIKQCPIKITIIDKQSIKKYLDYAIQKYGKKYIDLYNGK
jgi:hypothetical protein